MAEPITNVLGIVAIKHCGEYDATMHYEKLNVVTYNGSSYCAKDSTIGNLPTNTTYWDLIAEKGDKGDAGQDGYTPVKGTDYWTDDDIAAIEEELSSDVADEVSTQVGDLVSATPLAATSTAEMTDTSRIYVNTTDGNWYYYNGTAWTAGGTYQSTVPSEEIVSARKNVKNITFAGLNNRIDYTEKVVPFNSQTIQNADLNNLLEPKNYWVYGTITHVPTKTGLDFSAITAYVVVEGLNPERNASTGEITHYRCLMQRYYPYYVSANGAFRGHFTRLLKWNGNTNAYEYETWNIVPSSFLDSIFQADNKLRRYNLGDQFASNGQISTATDLNTLVKEGSYILTATSGNTNMPTSLASSALIVKNECNLIYEGGNNWIIQTCMPINGSEVWQRTILYRGTNSVYNNWIKIYPNSTSLQLSGKKIVNFGDSIFGNTQGTNSVSKSIESITGATVYNLGFGGCQMSDRNDSGGWNAFSMCNIADSIANDDFTMQDNAVADTSWTSKPNYFDNSESLLKSIDYSTVDYATIAYGTNDYTAGDTLDNPNNPKDVTTFAGALRHSIETIQSAYPNIRIILGSPCFRLWDEGGTIVTSDTKEYAGGFNLIEMTEKVKEIATEYHLPFVDAYNNLGINKFNYTKFFNGTDLTHPNAYGNNLLGRLYGMKILGSE